MRFGKEWLMTVLGAGAFAGGLAVGCGDDEEDTPQPPLPSIDAGITIPDTGVTTDGGTPMSILPSNITCDANNICRVPLGTYAQDMTWAPDNTFVVVGGATPENVVIGDGATLTILPGTEIRFSGATGLVIDRGAMIMAEGTSANPITFTSAEDPGNREPGDWGGVIINGRAPVNCGGATGQCEGEGGSGTYGGTDPADNSGVMRYVRIEFSGNAQDPQNEYNGLALQGVGSGTTLEFIHIHRGSDDGIEFFGGTVNAKYILLTGNTDDQFDWTFGWTGKVQYVVAQQYSDEGERGIEADNNEDANDATPRSNPILSNLTFIGADPNEVQTGAVLRRGTGGQLWSAVFTGFERCIDIDSDATFANAQAMAGNLAFAANVYNCATQFDEEMGDLFDVSDYVLSGMNNPGAGTSTVVPASETILDVGPDLTMPNFVPTDMRITTGGLTPNDPFFDTVTFKGGVDPANDWTTGWTRFPQD